MSGRTHFATQLCDDIASHRVSNEDSNGAQCSWSRHACDLDVYAGIVLALCKVCPDTMVLAFTCVDVSLLQQLPLSLQAQAIWSLCTATACHECM